MSDLTARDRQEITAGFLRRMREQMAPDHEGSNTKWVTCRRCGDEFLGWMGRAYKYCPTCSAWRQVTYGQWPPLDPDEHWRRNVAGAYKYWRAEAEKLGLLTADDDKPMPPS